MERRFEVRVWLPDRPGALGELAGRIGEVGGDVVEIEILETGGGSAVDDLTVLLPAGVTPERLVESIQSAPGVAVEEIVELGDERQDVAAAVLGVVRDVAGAPPAKRLGTFTAALRRLTDGEWAAAVELSTGRPLAMLGEVPDPEWLAAFLYGSRHLGGGGAGVPDTSPGEIIWCVLDDPSGHPSIGVASGRGGRVFHAREREHVHLIGEIVGQLIAAASAAER